MRGHHAEAQPLSNVFEGLLSIEAWQKLGNTSWDAKAETLIICATALVFSAAEYCAPVWVNSCHIRNIGAQLN